MSNQNLVTWSLVLLPENAAKIDQINRILLGSENITKSSTAIIKDEVKETKSVAEKDTTETAGVSQSDLQAAAKDAKTEHGVDFVKETITAVGGTLVRSLPKSLSSIDVEKHDEFLELLNVGPTSTEQSSDELEDDFGYDEDDLDGEEAPTAEAVKIALKAHAKEHGHAAARKIMNDNGAAKLQNVDDCTPAQLTAMFKLLA